MRSGETGTDGRRQWWALQVGGGHEMDVRKRILDIPGLWAAVPWEMRSVRRGGQARPQVHLYMPGYVFMRGELTDKTYYALRRIPHMLRILGSPKPEPIPQGQMLLILSLARHGLEAKPPRIIPGPTREEDRIDGPLGRAGLTRVRSVDRRAGRATLDVRFLDKICTVTVTVDIQPGERGA